MRSSSDTPTRGSLGVVTPMSPSNTVAGAPAADIGRDPAGWLAVAQDGGGGTFDGLAAPLTGSPLLDGVPDADLSLLDAVPPLVTALWPVLWQRRLEGRRERRNRRPAHG